MTTCRVRQKECDMGGEACGRENDRDEVSKKQLKRPVIEKQCRIIIETYSSRCWKFGGDGYKHMISMQKCIGA